MTAENILSKLRVSKMTGNFLKKLTEQEREPALSPKRQNEYLNAEW